MNATSAAVLVTILMTLYTVRADYAKAAEAGNEGSGADGVKHVPSARGLIEAVP